MKGRALDNSNDIIINHGVVQLVESSAEAIQNVRSVLLYYLGEWFLSTNTGVPYFQEIFKKPADLAKIESILKTEIIQSHEIKSLESFSLDYDSNTRLLSADFSATTEEGTEISNTVTINNLHVSI